MDKKLFEYVPEEAPGLGLNAVIKIFGVGSGGVNAVDTMIESGVDGVDYIVANTDAQDLLKSKCETKLVLGMNLTKGLGAGNDPAKGREAALEDKSKIAEFLKGADMVFLATSLGGGTGTGSTPVIAEICKSLGILTVAVVTLPFSDEGQKKMETALEGLEKMKSFVDAYVVIPNDKLNIFEDENITLKAGLKMIDRVLCDSVAGIVELITRPGHINRDINDVKTVLSEKGQCILGIGEAAGEGRALKAVEAALANPLLKGTPIHGAEKVLVNIVGKNITLKERSIVMNFIKEIADKNAQTFFGYADEEAMGDVLKVTIIAAGLGKAIDVSVCHPSFYEMKEFESKSELMNEHEEGFKRYPRGNFSDRPVFERIHAKSGNRMVNEISPSGNSGRTDEQKIEIPTFMRKSDKGEKIDL